MTGTSSRITGLTCTDDDCPDQHRLARTSVVVAYHVPVGAHVATRVRFPHRLCLEPVGAMIQIMILTERLDCDPSRIWYESWSWMQNLGVDGGRGYWKKHWAACEEPVDNSDCSDVRSCP